MLRNDCIVKYSVDPALTDIRGEFPRQAEANLGGNAGCRSLAWGAAAFFVSQEIASYETKKALGFFERIKYIFLENIKIEVTVQ